MQWSAQRKLFVTGEELRLPQTESSENQRKINLAIIQLYSKKPDLSTIIYSFHPGTNLTKQEKEFVLKIIEAGPRNFAGWQYLWMTRVARASGLRDPRITRALKRHGNHPRGQIALEEANENE